MVWQALSLPHQWHVMDALEQLRQSLYEAQASAAAGRGIHASTSTKADNSSVHSLWSPGRRRCRRAVDGGPAASPAAAAPAAIRGGRAMALFRVMTSRRRQRSIRRRAPFPCSNAPIDRGSPQRPADRPIAAAAAFLFVEKAVWVSQRVCRGSVRWLNPSIMRCL